MMAIASRSRDYRDVVVTAVAINGYSTRRDLYSRRLKEPACGPNLGNHCRLKDKQEVFE